MRLFVGVGLDAAVARAFEDVSAELQRRVRTLAPHARLAWVPPQNAHITVRFIGHVDEARATAITSALRPAVDVAPFDLVVRGVGTFPENRGPRVIWAGLKDGVEALKQIEEEVSARLERCGVEREGRPYHPHLTIGRVKEGGGLRARPLLDGLEDRTLGVSRVEAITLFESRLSPKGPTYGPLQSTNLRYSIED